MFEFLKSESDKIIDHWYVPVEGFNTSGKEFYTEVEKEIKAREIPDLDIAYVDFAEGGALSRKREYLRMSRERLVFDVCAAKFGTGFFFSCRCVQLAAVIRLWQLFIVLAAVLAAIVLALRYAGIILGPIILVTVAIFLIYLLRNTVALGLTNLDAALLNSPLFGAIYEKFFRKETYFRYDTRLMYLQTVNAAVKAKVEEVTGAKGIRLLNFMEHSPILWELYKPRARHLSSPSEPPCPASTNS